MTEVEIPEPLPYPVIQPFEAVTQLNNLFCYVLKQYPLEGISLTVVRKDGNVCVRIADWTGKLIDAATGEKDPFISQIMKETCPRLVLTMQLIGIPKALFYFSRDDKPRLVDVVLTATKFVSPGFLFDFFGKQGLDIQQIVGNPVFLSPEEVERIKTKVGVYVHDKYIIKPSQFKFIVNGVEATPMYGVLTCETKPAS